MATAGELLKAAGFGFEHVVASRVYITDGAEVPGHERSVRAELPEGSAGARHGDCRRFPARPYQVEITMTAYRGPQAGDHHTGRRRLAR